MGHDGTNLATGTGSVIDAAPERLLFVWLSPSFPVGAFAYSQGLEQAVERGLVASQAALEDWLSALIEHGPLRNDLILMNAAHGAVVGQDWLGLMTANELACALQPSMERSLEAVQQGGSFLQAIGSSWGNAAFAAARAQLPEPVAYSVAVGVAAAAHQIPREAALDAYAFAWAGTQTSAAIRLSIVGQTGAQAVMASLAGALSAAARRAVSATLDDVGGAVFSADLASLEHETQYSRLFRS
jgi:urease accessory protein